MIKDQIKKQLNKKQNIHYKLFKQSFVYPDVTKDLLKNLLPQEIFKKIKIEDLKLTNKSFVSEEHNEHHSDLVFKTKISGLEGYIYFLCEHQSTNDSYIGVRLLEYTTSIIREHMQEAESKNKKSNKNDRKSIKAPIVLSIIIYGGKEKYKGPKCFSDIFENAELAEKLMFKDIHVQDLQSKEIKTLGSDGKASAAEILLKLGTMRDVMKELEENIELLKQIFKNIPYIEKATDYIFYINSGKNIEKLVNLIKEITQKEEIVMNLATHFKNEGIRQGMLEGKLEGKLEGIREGIHKGELKGKIEGKLEGKEEIAINMIKYQADLEFIKKCTQLSQEKIQELYIKYSK